MFGFGLVENLIVFGFVLVLIILPVYFFKKRVRVIDSSYLKKYLFSFEGRATRLEYWMYNVAVFYGTVVVGMIIIAAGEGAENIIFIVFFLVYIWSLTAIQVKRWQDRDKSGWWVLINLVPFIGNIWALIDCGFVRGTEGKNRFGEDPLERSTSNKEEITASEEVSSGETTSDKEEITSNEEAISDNDKDSPEDKLAKLSELKEKGLIDEADYNSKKEEILKTI
jgi:uncharacterized membrane protein YhaH (DUF805 family)